MSGTDGLRELQQQRDGLKAQLAALENAIPPTQAADQIMASIKGVDPFNAPQENEWVAGNPSKDGGCCVIS